ncbi:MAG TPA: hypothetical protein VGO55_01920 [Allosphingosinicella sp.]|jgi:hypothetical protein|nr:hypothetical protein [Allosphingosinicella sp.]
MIGAAAGQHIGCENLCIPAAARPDLDHRVAGPDAEESERLARVAVAVAKHVGRRSGRRRDRGLERIVLGGAEASRAPLNRGRGGAGEDQKGAGGAGDGGAQGVADHVLLPK